MISVFVLDLFGFKNLDFWLFPGVLEGLGSSGKLVGTISTYPGTYKCPGSRVMTKTLGGGSQDTDFNKGFTEGFFFTKFTVFSEQNRALKVTFLAFPGGPGQFRKVREADRNHFHLSWYLQVPGITSYDQKPLGKALHSTQRLLAHRGSLEGRVANASLHATAP